MPSTWALTPQAGADHTAVSDGDPRLRQAGPCSLRDATPSPSTLGGRRWGLSELNRPQRTAHREGRLPPTWSRWLKCSQLLLIRLHRRRHGDVVRIQGGPSKP